MARRLLFLVAWLAVAAGAAHAQPSPGNVATADECSIGPNESLQQLEARRTTLEQDKARFGEQRTAAARKVEEDLLEVVFKIECLKTQPPVIQKRSVKRAPPAPATEAAKPKELVEITTYYATNRNKVGGVDPATTYGSNYVGNFQYGRAVVTIPPTHQAGEIESKTLWKLQFTTDPSKHFVLKSVSPLDLDAARKEMSAKINGSQTKSMLVFVHGYNTTFADAAMRTAQIAYDLNFPGMPFFFSWPSAGKVRAYLPDEEAARLSEAIFENLIDDITTSLPVTDVYIVAHSMGTRIAGHALQARQEKGKPSKHLRELLLAAPDINAELFKSVIAPQLAKMAGLRTTVYASSGDLALKASKIVHGFRRVGETTDGVFTFAGLDTVDATSASVSTRALGHSYVVDTPSVIDDIKAIVMRKATTRQRGLNTAGAAPNQYWRFPEKP